MRLAERLARLERVDATDPRMTGDEIDAAAARYKAQLTSDGTPFGGPVVAALTTWRELVEGASTPWLQRTYAGMSPMDAYL